MKGKPGTFVIAEAGVNHNGSRDRALQLVEIAAESGADAVKFQTFRAAEVVSAKAPKAEYQLTTTDTGESQLEMIRKLELTEADHEALIARARELDIEFLSTPFDLPSLKLLTGRFRLATIKIPSGEITNAVFLLQIARMGVRVIMSTGMSSLAEIEAALGVIAFGFTAPLEAAPHPDAFTLAYASESGQAALREKVRLLHCTTEYPAPYAEVNLRAIETLAQAFGLPVGLSDHTSGIHIPIAAVALGASIVEKHFTVDRGLPGPDHAASIERDELAAMVRMIRDVEIAMGDGIKRPASSEWKNRPIARKSLVAAQRIGLGEEFTTANLTCKRPGDGRSPFDYWIVLGTLAERAYDQDDTIAP